MVEVFQMAAFCLTLEQTAFNGKLLRLPEGKELLDYSSYSKTITRTCVCACLYV